MSKYDEVIGRAVAAMPRDIAERHATYNRARSALIERLRSVTPPLPEVAIEAEQAALEAAIQRVEAQFSVPADEVFDPPPAHRLDEPRYGLRIAMIGGAVVAVGAARRVLHLSLLEQRRQNRISPTPSTGGSTRRTCWSRREGGGRAIDRAGALCLQAATRSLSVHKPRGHARHRQGAAPSLRHPRERDGDSLRDRAGQQLRRSRWTYAVSRKAGTSDSPQPSSVRSNSSSGQALYFDSDTRLIHGAGVARAIGQTVRAGCFLLIPTDLAEL